ncbi:MAG: hypothetical protein M3142_01845 [Bacteroidota bacterium]|nr:hypothetical protein [Bacteroidota bacterium]
MPTLGGMPQGNEPSSLNRPREPNEASRPRGNLDPLSPISHSLETGTGSKDKLLMELC